MTLDEYNNQLGSLYTANEQLFAHSIALSRCEGQTRLFAQWSDGTRRIPLSVLPSLFKFAGKILRDLLYIFLSRRITPESAVSPGKTILVFSYFDWRNDDNGTLREEYLRSILNDEENVLCVYKLVNPGLFARGPAYIRCLKSIRKKFLGHPEHAFLTFISVAQAIYRTGAHAGRFRNSDLDIDPRGGLTALALSAHWKEIIDGTVYALYLQEILAERLLIYKPRLLLSVWENQPWERVIELAKKRISPTTVSKGFQHTGFSKKLLQHYPADCEKNLMGYPDIILSNGEVNHRELTRIAAFKERARVGCALRQDKMLARGIPDISDLSVNEKIDIVFAFPWDQSIYPEILRDLEQIPKQATVYLKFHPDYPDWKKVASSQSNFIVTQAPWPEIGKKCRLLLANDNSLMFEGFYHGMHTAVYDLQPEFEKRDFGSPLVHFDKKNLARILDGETKKRINYATTQMTRGGYLNRYFVRCDLETAKSIFFTSGGDE